MDGVLIVFSALLWVMVLWGVVALAWIGLGWHLCHKAGWQQSITGHYHHLVLGVWPLLGIGLTVVLYGKVSALLVLLFLVLTSLLYFGSGLWDHHQRRKQLSGKTPLRVWGHKPTRKARLSIATLLSQEEALGSHVRPGAARTRWTSENHPRQQRRLLPVSVALARLRMLCSSFLPCQQPYPGDGLVDIWVRSAPSV